ncbi:MAG: GNAT family N-acetyltransferase [Clostridiaceae bacterium]|nr:GNAT family N-acetyltransferase [Clostridiaceae bacterium]
MIEENNNKCTSSNGSDSVVERAAATTEQKFTVRPIRADDADRIYDYFQSFSERTKHFFMPHAIDRAFAEKLANEDRLDPNTNRFVAVTCSGNREIVVGYVFFWNWTKRVPWLGIGVRDGFQSRGLGSLMMRYAVDTALAYKKGGILLTTLQDNIRAQGLYRKFGYEIIGRDMRDEFLLILNFPDKNIGATSL